MDNSNDFVSKLGYYAKNCMISCDENTVGIYMLGFHGSFSKYHVFLNGKEGNVCPFCLNRTKNILKECSMNGFCLGFRSIRPQHFPFDLTSLLFHLRKEGYTVRENYRNGYLCHHHDKEKPIVTIHLIDIS